MWKALAERGRRGIVEGHVVDIQRGALGAVPAVWVDSGRPTLAASLIFRAGMVDETLPTAGRIHLVEHLALGHRESGPLHVNGSVGLLQTSFDFHGPRDAVLAALGDVCAWLREPDLHDVERESGVLRAESEYRGGSAARVALLQRFGAGGPGLAGYDEPGLTRVSDADVRAVIRALFVDGNAIIALDGPPPPDYSVALPSGPPVPVPPLTTDAAARRAAYVHHFGVTMSGEVERSASAVFLGPLLQRMLTETLRDAAGGAYAPWSSYEPVSEKIAVVHAGSDVSQALLPVVARQTYDGLAALVGAGVSEEILEEFRLQAVQALRDPYQVGSLAWRAAHGILRGEAPQTLEELIAEVQSVRAPSVTADLNAFVETLLVGLPGSAARVDDLPLLTMPTRSAAAVGATYRSANAPADSRRLIVGSDVVQVGSGHTWQSVSYAETAALFKTGDGGRRVVARNGWSIVVEPTMWRKGRHACTELDARVPADLHVLYPERAAADIPQPASLPVRVREFLRRPTPLAIILFVLGAALVIGGFLARRTFIVLPGGYAIYHGVKLWRTDRKTRTGAPA